jgi:hypothetical protein
VCEIYGGQVIFVGDFEYDFCTRPFSFILEPGEIAVDNRPHSFGIGDKLGDVKRYKCFANSGCKNITQLLRSSIKICHPSFWNAAYCCHCFFSSYVSSYAAIEILTFHFFYLIMIEHFSR